MLRFSVNVAKDTATPAMDRLRRAMRPEQLATIAAREGAALVVSNFEQLAAYRHRDGVAAVSHNFYLAAADSTNGAHSGRVAYITTHGPAGIRQRLLGGDIQPVNAVHLFIPLPGTPAEGRTPGDFTGMLTVIWNARTGKGVAKEKGKDGRVLFALSDYIRQDPDPRVYPDNTAFSNAFRNGIARHLRRAWKRDQAGAA